VRGGLIRLLVRLYPPRWRARYGNELERAAREALELHYQSFALIAADMLWTAGRQRFGLGRLELVAAATACSAGLLCAALFTVGIAGVGGAHSGSSPLRAALERHSRSAVYAAGTHVIFNPKTGHATLVTGSAAVSKVGHARRPG
jgi:hypothetical protein